MPLSNCPFTLFNNLVYRPVLLVKIINPHTGKNLKTIGLIDTGADECAIPATFAPLLGHNLQDGKTKTIDTGNGETIAYSHTTRFEIYHPVSGELLHTIDNTPIDFMPNLSVVLLGVNSFLSEFVLKINYPKQTFSIKYPE
jgi:hypothetical protein